MSQPMLRNEHADRKDLINLKKNINKKIELLKKAKKDIDLLLNQEVLTTDIDILKFIETLLGDARYLIGCLDDYQTYQEIERKHPPQAFTKERTYKRDLCLSVFHRSMNRQCHVFDLDLSEVRKINGNLIPVLLIDAKKNLNLEKFIKFRESYFTSLRVYHMVAQKLGVPFWIVGYFPPKMNIIVYKIIGISKDTTDLDFKKEEMTAEQFKQVIEKL